MKLLKTNLSLFAYDKNKNYAAEMQKILDKGESNLTTKDYSDLANLEKAANEKIADMDKSGTNKWGATQSSKYQDAYAGLVAGSGNKNGGKDKDDVHYTPPSASGSSGTYQPIDTSGIDWDKMYLSDSQYKQVQAYGQAYTAAMAAGNKDEAERYHQQAEGIRAKAASGIGYSGGNDGSQYLPFPIEEIPDQEKTADDIWNWTHQKAGLRPTYDPREELSEQNYDSQDYWNQALRLIGEPRPKYTAPEPTAEQKMSAQERWDMMNSMAGNRPEYTYSGPTAEQSMGVQDRWNTVNALAGPRPEYTAPELTAEQTMSPEERYKAILGMVGDAPVFESRWDEDKNKLARAYLDMNYDNFLNSNQYQALANQYNLQGKNAAQNVLGQIASRTGGLGSSYAGQVANQSYNNYMSQLSAAAYDMYQGELKTAYDKALAAYDYDDVDYGRYLDALSQWNKNYGYADDAFRESLKQTNYLQAQDYSKYLDAMSQWNKDRTNADNTFQNVVDQQTLNQKWEYGLFLDSLSQWNKDLNNASDVITQTLDQQNYNQEWDYTQFLNNLAQWNVEHGYATDAINNVIDQANSNRNWDRSIYESDTNQWTKDRSFAMDALDKAREQSNRNQEWSYGVLQQEKADAMDRIQSYLSTGGSYADLPGSLLEASGYSQAELDQLQNYYQSKLKPSTQYVADKETPAKEQPKSDPKVTNEHGDGWVTIDGYPGRYSWTELYNMVESGKVQEVYDEKNNTITYKPYKELPKIAGGH